MGTILVVDDDPIVVDLAAYLLESAGHQVHSADDGHAGLAEAQRLRPDLILVDWSMPHLSGPEFCREIRRSDLGDLAEVPIILLTAVLREDQIAEGISAGASEYLAKPFQPAQLADRVGALLGDQ